MGIWKYVRGSETADSSPLYFVMTQEISSQELNPLEPNERLASPSHVNNIERVVHPQDAIFAQDSAVAKAEKIERHGADDEFHDSATKRVKIDPSASQENGDDGVTKSERQKGVAPIKSESVQMAHS